MTDGDILEKITKKNNPKSSDKNQQCSTITKDIPIATEAANMVNKTSEIR